MSSENVYLIASADHLANAVKHAVQHDKPRTLSQLKQGIERGLRIFEAWMEDHGGRVLLFQGDEVFAELPGENLDSLPDLHAQVQDAWGDSVTIGIGLDLTEATKAAENGRKRGGKRIVFYAPEIEQHLDDENSASESHDATQPDSDPDELKAMALNKANTPSPGPPTPNEQPAFFPGAAASPPAAPSPLPAGQVQPSGADMPPTPSSTNAAAGLSPVEAQMRQMADKGEAEGARAEGQVNQADDGATGPAQLKQGIARILMKVKEQAQVLEQLKEQAPEAYKAIVGMVQIVAAIGKQLMPPKGEGQDQGQEEGQPIAKAEGGKPVYLGSFLSPEAHDELLRRFPPIHPNVFGHHATLQFGPTPEHIAAMGQPGSASKMRVVGHHADDKGQAVTVQMHNPVTRATELRHITISTANDPVKNKPIPPVYSNELTGQGKFASNGNAAKVKPVESFELDGVHDHFPRTMAKSYIIESDDDVHQLRRSYQVEGVQSAPLKSTGINGQVNIQDHTYNKEELAPNEPLPPPGRLSKIRKAAMAKKATGDAVTAAPPGLDVTAGLRKEVFHGEDAEFKKWKEEQAKKLGKAALPMPEEGAHAPPKASGSLLSRLRGDASPQAHKFFHQTPGQAAHVGMDGKPEGKNVVRQFQSGMVKPINNRAETDTGQSHPVSALNPTDSEGRGQGG